MSRDRYLLLRINQTWQDGISADDLYEITRGWWAMSMAKAQEVTRVFAVAHGVVREVYEPLAWEHSHEDGQENRVGFTGTVAEDRDDYVGADVSDLFRQGAANPVRYIDADAFAAAGPSRDHSVELPTLEDRVRVLLDAFRHSLLWHQSRAAQEQFHSNTIAWLLRRFPVETLPVLRLLGGSSYEGVDRVHTLREKRNLDIVIETFTGGPNVVVENKLYSVPDAEQLSNYTSRKLPWSDSHGEEGAPDTRYVLLSLMTPAFQLPEPWEHVGYRELAEALDGVDSDALGQAADEFQRYRSLVHRLVSLAEAVNPLLSPDEQFSAAEVIAPLPEAGLGSAISRMRFSALAQALRRELGDSKRFDIRGDRGGVISYYRRVSEDRSIWWQFQSDQLRLAVVFTATELQGKAARHAREQIVEDAYAGDFIDFTSIEHVLGPLLAPRRYATGEWLSYNPGFVYRGRKVDRTASTEQLVTALAAATRHVDVYADRIGYEEG